jgi:hypothetical protein
MTTTNLGQRMFASVAALCASFVLVSAALPVLPIA